MERAKFADFPIGMWSDNSVSAFENKYIIAIYNTSRNNYVWVEVT